MCLSRASRALIRSHPRPSTFFLLGPRQHSARCSRARGCSSAAAGVPTAAPIEWRRERRAHLGRGDLELDTDHDVGVGVRAAQPGRAVSLRRQAGFELKGPEVVPTPPVFPQAVLDPLQQERPLRRGQPHLRHRRRRFGAEADSARSSSVSFFRWPLRTVVTAAKDCGWWPRTAAGRTAGAGSSLLIAAFCARPSSWKRGSKGGPRSVSHPYPGIRPYRFVEPFLNLEVLIFCTPPEDSG